LLSSAAHAAPAAAPVKLWRLDCGEIWVADLDEYSDTRAYVGQSRRLVASCYLIRHGDSYMLWDTGLPEKDALGKTLTRGPEESEAMAATIVDQLARLGVKPAQVSIIGISHYHFDHTGQAADFPGARLLMGKGDLEVLRQPGSARAAPLQHWITGGGAVEEVSGDRDVFGDGSVVMLDLPGHTPGHHGLMVRLAGGRWVLLSGDVAHFRENLETLGVPGFNVDRARSLASLDRFRQLARNLKATVVIQHDERDVGKLPAFPAAAE
jgi:glyoxylase-like metal-dependent hydrolase (beta-lactamase superfamily II)